MEQKTRTYYRVIDLQCKKYFATGYNAENMSDLIKAFTAYINGDNLPVNKFENWQQIADYIQPVKLEWANGPFEEIN